MRSRPYLSYSQKSLWKSSPKAYIDRYIHDRTFSSKETEFGHKMAEALEKDELTGDALLDAVMLEIPKFECMDQETHVELKVGKEIVPLFGRMDSRKTDYSAFKEYKTGRTPWTQRKVDEDAQLTFYATMCYLITKKIPEDIELVWVPTEISPHDPSGQTIICTGEVKRFHTRRGMGHIINEMADMRKVWREIGEACEKELL